MIISQDREFRAPETMTPEELGDHLARLVWENFSDFVTEQAGGALLERLGLLEEEGIPNQQAAEEVLIFLLWAHTRGVQRTFGGTESGRLARAALDVLHKAVFEDLVANGTPAAELPIFEQRISVRYSQYSQAANESDQEVGSLVIKNLSRSPEARSEDAAWLTQWAVAMTKPLQDYYGEVTLVESS